MKTNSGFDFLAPVYDQLARFVFRKSIVESQIHFLDRIPPTSKVLILGGGTGWLLEEISKRNPTSAVWYVELSNKMIERAQRRNFKNEVHFIQGTEKDIPAAVKFDVMITNFYFDLFSEKQLHEIIKHLNQHTDQLTILIVTDFVKNAWWHSGMLKVMYLFFKVICGIDASTLPNWHNDLKMHRWKETNHKFWYLGFIKSSVWVAS